MYVQHLSLSFHQISCRRSACGRACAGGEVIKLLAWGSVQHSQTTLMPCAAICQNELWSRILLIISQVGKKKKSLISRVFTCLSLSYSHLSCVVFTRETNKIWKAGIDLEIELLPQFMSHSLKKNYSLIQSANKWCPSHILFLLLPGCCCVSKALLGEIRQIPSQANSTISAAGLW